MRFRSPEVAMGSGSDGVSTTCGCSCGWPTRNSSVTGGAIVFSLPSVIAGVTGCGLHGSDFFLLLLLVGDAEFFFHLHAELVGGAPELGHELAQLAGEFRQLLRPKEKQSEEDEDGAVLKARHKSVP